MTTSTSNNLPSRRELRLQREAAERAAQAQDLEAGTAETEGAPVAGVHAETAQTEDPAAGGSLAKPVRSTPSGSAKSSAAFAADSVPTATLEPVVEGSAETNRNLSHRARATRSVGGTESSVFARPSAGSHLGKFSILSVVKGTPKKAAFAAGLTAVAMAGSAAVAMTLPDMNDASAAQGFPNPQATRGEIHPTVPDSLKKAKSAADSARYHGIERELADTVVVRCEVRRGANSLVSAFVEGEEYVVSPMAAGTYRLSSSFGFRYDPFTFEPSRHLGEDFAAAAGTPIYAIADGTVIHVGEGIDGRSSNLIVIAHEINGEKYTSWYVHMYDDGVFVELGDQVTAGQHIGAVGSKGYSTGPHLHFEIHSGHELSLPGGSLDNILNPLETLEKLGAIDVTELC